jgi:two-component system chemotaxis sensor kinase CheA
VLDVSNLIERSTAIIEPGSRVSEKLAGLPPQLNVMVVDDTLMVRELQRSILERGGYRVRTASDGAEALAMLNEQPADLVVTDLEMPNLDGFQLTSSIRAHPRLANIPVLIVSSHAGEEDQQRGLEAGADGYIIKTSFDEAGLLSAVSRLLGRSGPPARRSFATTTATKPMAVTPK